MNLTDGEKQAVEETKRVWDMARTIYKIPDTVTFNLLFTDNKVMRARTKPGCHAVGTATVKSKDGQAHTVEVRLNRKAIEQDLKDTLDDTIPHEIAHAVCGIFPEHGSEHDAGWQKVCRRLGGNGMAKTKVETYDLRLRVRWRHKYKVGDREVWLTDVKHNRLQSLNSRYRFPDTLEAIEAHHYTGEKR